MAEQGPTAIATRLRNQLQSVYSLDPLRNEVSPVYREPPIRTGPQSGGERGRSVPGQHVARRSGSGESCPLLRADK